MQTRKVQRIAKGRNAVDGAGVKLVRVIGFNDVRDFDPFLMLDAFDSQNPQDYIKGFPLHPHRGIETVTYLVEGEIEHKDSLGNHGTIRSGDCQWMTAGRSILHQEMPQASPRMLGLQLWINLPAAQKMAPPKYRDILAANIPLVEEKHATVRIICGQYQGARGAIQADYVKARFLDVSIAAGASWKLDTPAHETLFTYIISGSCAFEAGEQALNSHQAVLFTEGDTLEASASMDGARLIIMSGAPLKEPIAWGGPIVMNTEAELRQAEFELENGTFIKP